MICKLCCACRKVPAVPHAAICAPGTEQCLPRHAVGPMLIHGVDVSRLIVNIHCMMFKRDSTGWLGGSSDEVDDEGDTDPVFIDREALSLVGLQLTAVFAHVEGHLSARRGLGLR